MSHPDENHQPHQGFQRPEEAPPFDEQTLPFVDLYGPSSDIPGGWARGPEAGPSNARAGGGGPYSGGQFPPRQYAPSYQSPQSPYEPYPPQRVMATTPPPYGYYAPALAEHPQSTTVLVLGLLGFVVPVTPFIAWYMGNKAKAEIQRGAPYPYSGSLKVGHVVGKVLGILTIVGVSLYVLLMILMVIAAMAF